MRVKQPLSGIVALLTSLTVTVASLVAFGSAPAAAAQATRVTANVNAPNARATELVFIRGRVLTGSGPAARAKVKIQAKSPGGKYRTIARRVTGQKGGYLVPYRAPGTRVYRAVVVRTDRYRAADSSPVRVRRIKAERTYDDRERSLRAVLGQRNGGPQADQRFGRRVIHGSYGKGILAKVGRSTSLVYGRMLERYRQLDGVRGRLGAPVSDVTCQLLEGACLQRFQNGTIYLNPAARKPVSVIFGRGERTSFMAVAASQEGYREPSFRGSKYNVWQGARRAWCGFYLAWASHASGNGNAFPRGDDFSSQRAEVERRGNLFYQPRRGAVAFIGSGSTPTHAALVLSVRRDGRIVTLEGNVGPHSYTGHPRGVFRRVRGTGNVLYYANPRY